VRGGIKLDLLLAEMTDGTVDENTIVCRESDKIRSRNRKDVSSICPEVRNPDTPHKYYQNLSGHPD